MNNDALPLHAPARLPPGAHVLVVDDQVDICDLLRRILERRGYCVTVAAAGRDALALLAGARFDLLITDILLPDACGWDLVRRARARDGAVGVIVLSGWDDEDLLSTAADLSVDQALGKPFTLEAVQRGVADTLCAVQRRRAAAA